MFKENHQSYLKVKIKSLSAESKIIRLEEKRARSTTLREGLYLHRVKDVRNESRAAQLAYAYLRGVPLKVVEPKATRDCDVDRRATNIVKKFGTSADGFKTWLAN